MFLMRNRIRYKMKKKAKYNNNMHKNINKIILFRKIVIILLVLNI